MRLEQLQCVIAIAEYRSLSQAARALYLSQPTLSVSLQNLEAELGVQIFERSHRGMTLTEKGKEVHQIAVRIQEDLNWLRQLSNSEEESAEVAVSAVPTFCNAAMLELLADLRQEHPEIILSVRENQRTESLSDLVNHIADLVVGAYTDDEEQQLFQDAAQNRIVIETLVYDRMYAYLPKHHPLAFEQSVALARLEENSVLLLREGGANPPHQKIGEYYCFSDRDSVMKGVSKGMGYAILPGLMALDNIYVETGLVTVVPLRDGLISTKVFLGYSSATPLTGNQGIVARQIRRISRRMQQRLRNTLPIPKDGHAPAEHPAIYY